MMISRWNTPNAKDNQALQTLGECTISDTEHVGGNLCCGTVLKYLEGRSVHRGRMNMRVLA